MQAVAAICQPKIIHRDIKAANILIDDNFDKKVFLVNHFISKDRSWMKLTKRKSREYLDGVQQFLNFASNHTHPDGMIPGSCRKCVHTNSWPIDVVQAHLMSKGICRGYNPWVFNGESSSAKTSFEIRNSHVQENPIEYADLHDMLHDMFLIQDMASGPMEEVPTVQQSTESLAEGPTKDALRFMKLLEDAKQPCYEGCKHYNKLSAIVHLYHMKCLNGWTNKSFTMLLQFFLDFLPSSTKLPKDSYEAKKIIKDLGLSYEKIYACSKDCILYWKENANLETCLNYNYSRWESNESKGQQSTNASS
ncbi:hypothetical protein SO802_023420 [Lithocarpus litseifolius]|uniref:Protein kinase domain-containing protein n=1 Tax=Lithocarpus litseifolius TaxID=425828 RepID=A0AAW2C6N0_9ROSI